MTSTTYLRLSGALACLALGLSVSACGSSGQPANASAGGQSGYGQGGQGQQGGGPGGFPGGSGKVAAVAGSTAQVQGQGGQVAVTWTSKTTFAQQVAASASDLKMGDCVVAMPSAPASGSSDDSDSGSTTVKAANVRITAAVDGSCTTALPGRTGAAGDGQGPGGGTPPEGAPEGGSGRGNGTGRPAMRGAFGEVTAVDGSSFTVASSRPDSSSSSTTVKTTVTTSSDTSWTTTKATTSKAVQVGRCVTSRGTSGSTGAIAATSITVSQAVDGQCSAGFGPGGAGGAAPGEAQGS